jgi:hypothetical protein
MLQFIPKTDQFICVVNKKIDSAKLLNALGHMTAGLVYQHRDNLDPMRFRDFVDMSGSVHPATSENAFIVLRAENSNQIRTLRNKLIEQNTPFTDFTRTMVDGDYVTQQAEFDKTAEADLEYFGVCFFMNKEASRELTKKFSLYVG